MHLLLTPQPARHPNPTVKATALAYLMFERPDPDKAEQFLTDFGLCVESRAALEALARLPGASEAEPKPEVASGPAETASRVEPTKERAPRVDWAGLLRRTFAPDVFARARCGGRRRVLAYLTAPDGVRALVEHLALPSQPAKRAPAQGPPRLAWC